VFEQLVTARIEPTSKQDAARVLGRGRGAGAVEPDHEAAVPGYAEQEWRDGCRGRARPAPRSDPPPWCSVRSRPCGSRPKPGDSFREPALSKERRLEPQITGVLLTDATGMPLMVDAFNGSRAETKTMILLVQRFVGAHGMFRFVNADDGRPHT
jgi:hypothetical protein